MLVSKNRITLGNLYKIWDKVKGTKIDEGYSKFLREWNSSDFIIFFTDNIFLRVDGLEKGVSANVHGAFFENPYKQLDKIKIELAWLQKAYDLKRIACYINSQDKSLAKLLIKLGFTKECRLHKARKCGIIIVDVDCYVILTED